MVQWFIVRFLDIFNGECTTGSIATVLINWSTTPTLYSVHYLENHRFAFQHQLSQFKLPSTFSTTLAIATFQKNNMSGKNQVPSRFFTFAPNESNSSQGQPIFGSCLPSIFNQKQSKSQTEVLGDALSILRRAGSNSRLLPNGQSIPRAAFETP